MSSDGGRKWDAPEKLGDNSSTHGDIVIDRTGEIYAVWDMIDPEINDGSMGIYLSHSNKKGIGQILKEYPDKDIALRTQRLFQPRLVSL